MIRAVKPLFLLVLPVLAGLVAAAAPRAARADVACTGPAGGHLGAAPACDRLAALLAGRGVSVTLELTRDEPQLLAGRLVWQAGGQRRAGPVVEVTARDRPLTAAAGDRLVRGLLAVSDLP